MFWVELPKKIRGALIYWGTRIKITIKFETTFYFYFYQNANELYLIYVLKIKICGLNKVGKNLRINVKVSP